MTCLNWIQDIKGLSALLLICALGALACKSQDTRTYDPSAIFSKTESLRNEATTIDVDEINAKAIVITPKLASMLPHLKGSIGHVLLANQNLQAVFSVLSTKDEGGIIQSSLLSLFTKTEDSWQMLSGFKRFKIEPNDPKLILNSVDFNHDADGTLAMIVYHFRRKSPAEVITLAAVIEQKSRGISFIQAHKDNLPDRSAKIEWNLHLETASIALPTNYINPTGSSALFHQWLAFVNNDTPFGIGSYHTRLKWQPALAKAQSIVVRPKSTHIIDLNIGSAAVSMLPLTVSARLNCSIEVASRVKASNNALVRSLSHFRHQQTCIRRTITRETKPVVFEFEPEDASNLSSMRIFWATVPDKNYGTLVAANGGQIVNTRLPGINEVILRDIQQNTVVRHFEDRRASSASFVVEGREFGDLFFQPKNPNQTDFAGAALVRIVNSTDTDARILQLTDGDFSIFKHNALLVTEWPLSLELPSGNYRIEVLNGKNGNYCTSAPKIGADEATFDQCIIRKTTQIESDRTTFIPTEISPSNLDLSLLSATNIDLLPQLPNDSDPYFESPHSFAVFEYTSPLNHLTIRAFPVQKSFHSKWQKFAKLNADQNNVTLFQHFTRKMEPRAAIEIDCRPSSMSRYDYEQWIKKLSPDAIRYYNCRDTFTDPSKQSNWLGSLLKKINRPLSLTSAGLNSSSLPSLYHIPRVAVGTLDPKTKVLRRDQILESLKNGTSVYMTGATFNPLASQSSDAFMSTKLVRDSSGKIVLLGGFNMTAAPNIKEVTLNIFSEQGLIKSELITMSGNNPKKEVVIQIGLSRAPRFLRYELVGKDHRDGKLKKHVLAGTGFFDAAPKLAR